MGLSSVSFGAREEELRVRSIAQRVLHVVLGCENFNRCVKG